MTQLCLGQLPLNLQINGNLIQPPLSRKKPLPSDDNSSAEKPSSSLLFQHPDTNSNLPKQEKELFHSVILILSYHLMKMSLLQPRQHQNELSSGFPSSYPADAAKNVSRYLEVHMNNIYSLLLVVCFTL